MAERRASRALPPLSSSSASSIPPPVPPLPSSSDQELKSASASVPDRRILRSHYRRLKASIAEEKESLLNDDSSTFDTIVRRADDLYSLGMKNVRLKELEKDKEVSKKKFPYDVCVLFLIRTVSRPREQIADAEALLDISEAFLNVVKESRRGGGIKASDFVSSVVRKYKEPSNADENEETIRLDWVSLGLEATNIFHDAPGMSTMLGPMDAEAKKRKVPAPRRERGPLTEASRPQTVDDEAGEQRTETDKNIRVMFNVLRKCGQNGCELEYLVLNRDSFAETVENIFFLSFLVKDGRAGITIENGKQIVVFKYAPTADERSGKFDGGGVNGQVVNTQFVFRLDYKDWMIMKEMVEKGKELMPKRGHSNQPAGSSGTPIRKNSRNRGRVTIAETGNLTIELGGHCDDEENNHEDEVFDHKPSRHRGKKLLI